MYWWRCPNCKEFVDFDHQIETLFDEWGEAEFEPENGVIFHTITCQKCKLSWIMSISQSDYTFVKEAIEDALV